MKEDLLKVKFVTFEGKFKQLFKNVEIRRALLQNAHNYQVILIYFLLIFFEKFIKKVKKI